MRLRDYARSVRHTLVANRLRAALTLLGTVIGAASIVLLAGLLRSGEEMLVYSSQKASEADLISVSRDAPPVNKSTKVNRELGRRDQGDVEASPIFANVRASAESRREVVAEAMGRRAPDVVKDFHVRMVSFAPDALHLYRLEVEKGRSLNDDDLTERARVCIVGWEVWQKLFGTATALTDQRVRVEGHEWVIVGVLKSKPILGGGGDGTWMWNRKVLIPETTFDAMFQPDHAITKMYVRLSGSKELTKRMSAVQKLLSSLLLRTHGVENFKVESENSSEDQETLILSIIKGLLLSTALLSLFVGGINIMNIMLVTVTERTREIGVRRALGATRRAIWGQFLLEATFIASVGGFIGVCSGIFLTWLGATLLSRSFGAFAFHVELWSVGLGFSLSLFTGVVFGLFPAVRASRLDPVEALRFE